mgnify:CR=1 FL=1
MITKKYTDSGPGLLKIPVSFETKQMKVLVVSGFLGAGKTTFIKTMAQCSGQDFCILENEYGEVDVDTALLKEETENINVWEMTEGCICCSMKQSFASSLLTISGALDPEYLIVEAREWDFCPISSLISARLNMTGSSCCVRLLLWTREPIFTIKQIRYNLSGSDTGGGDGPAFKGRTYVSPGTGGDPPGFKADESCSGYCHGTIF